MRKILIISWKDVSAANSVMDTAGQISVGLSANGKEPYSHAWASAPDFVTNGMIKKLENASISYLCYDWPEDNFSVPEEVLTALSLSRNK